MKTKLIIVVTLATSLSFAAHLTVKKTDGSVIFYPRSVPEAEPGYTLIEVTPEIQAVIDRGGPFIWDTTNSVLVKIPVDLAKLKQAAKRRIARDRYKSEFGGFTDPTMGIFVRTDERTRNLLTSAVIDARANPDFVVPNWKLADGSFVTLTADNIIYLYGKVWEFIAGQFAMEKSLCEQIDAAETVEAVRAVRWE